MSVGLNPSALECSICLDEFKKPNITSCGHSFCETCIAPFLYKPCPNCREPISKITKNISLQAVIDGQTPVASTASKTMTSASSALGKPITASSSASSSASPVDASFVAKRDLLNQELDTQNFKHFAYLCGLSQGRYDGAYDARERVLKESLEAIGNNLGIVRSILDMLGLPALSERVGGEKIRIPAQDRVTRYRSFVKLDSTALSFLGVRSGRNASQQITIYEFNQMIENVGAQKVADMLREPAIGKNEAADILHSVPISSPAVPSSRCQPAGVYAYPSCGAPAHVYHPAPSTPPVFSSSSASRSSVSSPSTSHAVHSSPVNNRQWPSEIKECLKMDASTTAASRSKLLALLMILPDTCLSKQQKLLLIALHIDDKTFQTIKTRFDLPAGLKDGIKSSLDLVLAMYNRLGTEKDACAKIQAFLSDMPTDESIPCFTFRDLACASRRAVVTQIGEFGAGSKPSPGDLATVFFLSMSKELRYCLAMQCGFVGNRLEEARKDATKLLQSLRDGCAIDFNRDFHDLINTLMQMPLGDSD